MSGYGAFALLPILISGYLFNTIFYPLRYFNGHAEGQKLFFLAAGSGVSLAILVFALSGLIAEIPGFEGGRLEGAAHAIDRYVPVPYACKLILTMGLAVILGFSLNCLLWIKYGRRGRSTAKRVYNRLTDRFGNALCQILRKAADEQKLVLLNLKSRKVYCGRVLEVPQNIELADAYVELLPIFSGYRDKDTLRFGKERTEYPVITLWEARRYLASRTEVLDEFDCAVARFGPGAYDSVEIMRKRTEFQREIDEASALINKFGGPGEIDLQDWIKVFPIAEIESASFYDAEAYASWFGRQPPELNSIPTATADAEKNG